MSFTVPEHRKLLFTLCCMQANSLPAKLQFLSHCVLYTTTFYLAFCTCLSTKSNHWHSDSSFYLRQVFRVTRVKNKNIEKTQKFEKLFLCHTYKKKRLRGKINWTGWTSKRFVGVFLEEWGMGWQQQNRGKIMFPFTHLNLQVLQSSSSTLIINSDFIYPYKILSH